MIHVHVQAYALHQSSKKPNCTCTPHANTDSKQLHHTSTGLLFRFPIQIINYRSNIYQYTLIFFLKIFNILSIIQITITLFMNTSLTSFTAFTLPKFPLIFHSANDQGSITFLLSFRKMLLSKISTSSNATSIKCAQMQTCSHGPHHILDKSTPVSYC